MQLEEPLELEMAKASEVSALSTPDSSGLLSLCTSGNVLQSSVHSHLTEYTMVLDFQLLLQISLLENLHHYLIPIFYFILQQVLVGSWNGGSCTNQRRRKRYEIQDLVFCLFPLYSNFIKEKMCVLVHNTL